MRIEDAAIDPAELRAVRPAVACVFGLSESEVEERMRTAVRGEPEAAEMIGLSLGHDMMRIRVDGWVALGELGRMRQRWAAVRDQAGEWGGAR